MLRLSNSEAKAARRCPRTWYLNYYRGLGNIMEEAPGSALSIGNLYHDALAHYYDPAQTPLRPSPVAYVAAIAEADIAASPVQEMEIQKEAELVSIMLSGYLEWLEETGADGDLQITGSESMVEVELIPGEVTLLSKLDAPVSRISDGAKLALEHKTVGSLEQPLATLKLDTQLLTEHLVRFLLSIQNGATPDEALDQCQGVLYNMAKKVKRTAAAKPPFYDRVDVPHNLHELRNHHRHMTAIARQILSARARLDAGESHHFVVPPNPTRDCSWDCPFFRACPMADDGSDFEGALAGMYKQRDPLARYAGATALVEVPLGRNVEGGE